MCACFLAVQGGALVVCIGLAFRQVSASVLLDAGALWVIGQLFILPVSLGGMLPGALLRMLLGLLFQRPRRVALVTGAGIGLAGAIYLAGVEQVEEFHALGTCLLAGLAGGWVWWRIEKPWLERHAPSAAPAP